MFWLVGNSYTLGAIAGKTVLLVLTALLGLRVTERRALAHLRPFDVVTMVALGAVVGREATATSASYLQGAVAIVTLLALHQLLSRLRYLPGLRRVSEHRVRVIVREGRLDNHQLRVCGLVPTDVLAAMRVRGLGDLSEARLVIYEADGSFTVVTGASGVLVQDALRQAPDHGPLPRSPKPL